MPRYVAITLSFLVLCLVLLVIVTGLLFTKARDHFSDLAEPPDDSDLRIEYLDIPDEENAWYWFIRAARSVYLSPEQDAYVSRFGDDENEWNREEAERLLSQNQEALEYFQRGISCTQSQVPPGVTMATLHAVHYDQRMRFRGVLYQRVLHTAHTIDAETALEDAIDIIRFGSLVADSRGCFIDHAIGLGNAYLGIELALDLLSRIELGETEARKHIAALSFLQQDEEAWANMLCVEYCGNVDDFDPLVAEEFKGVDEDPSRREGDAEVRFARLSKPFVYQLNRTRKLFCDAYRMSITNTSSFYSVRREVGPVAGADANGWQLLMTGNYYGVRFFNVNVALLNDLPESACMWRSQLSVVQVMLALRVHSAETGTLPDSLDELVPEYFEAVPMDYFDGKSIKYSREKRLVYCVGKDLIDSGGTEEGDRPNKMPDPSWKIEF